MGAYDNAAVDQASARAQWAGAIYGQARIDAGKRFKMPKLETIVRLAGVSNPSTETTEAMVTGFAKGVLDEFYPTSFDSRSDYHKRLAAICDLAETALGYATEVRCFEAGGGTAYATFMVDAGLISILLGPTIGSCEITVYELVPTQKGLLDA